MNDGNFYNGGGLNISGAAMGQMQAHKVEAFAHRDIMQDASNSSQVLGGVQAGVAKLMDYKTETEARQQLEKIQTETQARVKRGLEAAPGSADSFFYEDGSINQSMIDDLGKEVAGQLEGINPTFIDPERGHRFAAERDEFSGNLATRVKGQADLHQLQAIRRTSEGRMQSLMESRDWSGAMSEVDRQVEAGILTQSEAEVKRRGIDRASASEEIAMLIDDDPIRAAEQLDSERYKDVFSYAQRQQFRRAVRAKLSEDNNAVVQQAVATGQMPAFASAVGDGEALQTGSGKGGKKPQSLCEFMEDTGDFTKAEIAWMQRRFWGEDVTGEVQEAARAEAMAFDVSKNMDEQREQFMNKYGRLGLKADWLKGVWKNAEEKRAAITSYSIDPAALLAKEGMAGRTLLDASMVKEMQAHLEKKDEKGVPWAFKEGGHLRKDKALMELIKAKADDDAATLAAKYEAHQTGVIAELTQNRILAEYKAWRAAEGKDASPLAQYNQLRDITKRLTNKVLGGSDDIHARTQVRAEYELYRNARTRQDLTRSQWEADVEARNKNMVLPLNVGDLQQVSLRFDSEQKDKPAGVLVPKSWLEGVSMELATVEATFDNKHFRAFRVVGTCEGEVPMMTHAAAVQGGWNPQSAYRANIRFMHGTKAARIVQEQEDAISQREAAETAAQLNRGGMGRAILEKEARLDNNGNLRVHYLPKEDGGGTYEVAGINNKYHPEMARKLKNLVELGRHQEARREAEQYIMKFTQPAADLLKTGGVTDSGAELFLRDVFMNGGEGGMKKVLNRALGLPDAATDAQTTQKLQEFMKAKTPRQLLDALKEKRLAWYAGIARANSKKQRFLDGWYNRTEDMYKKALNA